MAIQCNAGTKGLFRNRGALVVSLILIAVPLAIYGQAVAFDFVWDDETTHLAANPHLADLSLASFFQLWSAPYKGLYIPVSYTAWGLLKPVGQLISSEAGAFNPVIYHLANIICHILNGFLVYRLVRLLVANRWAALGGVLLFLVHPVQVESVVWVSEFRGLLSTHLGMIAVHLYLADRKRESSSSKGFGLLYAGGLVFFLLAILSKPSAVVFPLFAVLLDRFLYRKPFAKTAAWILPWVIATVPIILITTSVQTAVDETAGVAALARPLIWMDAINFYLYKLVNPTSLAASYGRTPAHVMGQWWVYAGWVIPLALAFFLWRFRRAVPVLGLASLLFVIGFLPMSGLVFFDFQAWSTVADRYLYLPMIGAALAFAHGLERVRQKSFWTAAGALLLFWGTVGAVFQVPVWKDSLSLWRHCIKVTSREPQAYNNRGNVYSSLSKHTKAIEDFSKAIALNPRFVRARFNRGNAYGALKMYEKAIADYSKAIGLNSRFTGAYYNRGIIFRHLGKHERAIADFSKAIALDPRLAKAHINRGNTFFILKNNTKAFVDFNKAIEINPASAMAYINRANLYRAVKDFARAVGDYDKAIALNPRFSEAYIGRGSIFGMIRRHERAVQDLTRAIEIDPRNTNAYFKRAVGYFHLKKYLPARRDVRKVGELGGRVPPNFLRALSKAPGKRPRMEGRR